MNKTNDEILKTESTKCFSFEKKSLKKAKPDAGFAWCMEGHGEAKTGMSREESFGHGGARGAKRKHGL